MTQILHPTQEQLGAFSLGRLEVSEASEIEVHLNSCETCSETLLDLTSNDTFLGLLIDSHQEYEADSSTSETLPGVLSSADFPNVHPRYQVDELIGEGGMGKVYKAQHKVMDRTVALKVINAKYFRNANAVDRFKREVRAAAKLSHPNIVTAFDADSHEDVHFMAMEYVDGTNLHDWVSQNGKMPWREAVECIYQVAQGLSHAHSQGMVHRDIKPHNLMRTHSTIDAAAEGATPHVASVKILDLGLAYLSNEVISEDNSIEPNAALTQAGAVMGTPDFIAPEQALDARQADARSDIYSLGATFFYLLTGRPPFNEGNAQSRIQQHQEATPPNIQTLAPDVPEAVCKVVSKMLEKDARSRFAKAQELTIALQPFADSRHQIDLPNSRSTTNIRLKRLKWALALTACFALSLGGWAYSRSGTLQINTPAGFDGDVLFSQTSTSSTGNESAKSFVLSAQEMNVHRIWAGNYKVSLQNGDQNRFRLDSHEIEIANLQHATLRILPTSAQTQDSHLIAQSEPANDSDDTRTIAKKTSGNTSGKSFNKDKPDSSGAQQSTSAIQQAAAPTVMQPAEVPADDDYYYYSCSLRHLIGDAARDSKIKNLQSLRNWYTGERWLWTYVSLDQPQSEAYFFPENRIPRMSSTYRFACRVKKAEEVAGRLILPSEDGGKLLAVPFKIAADNFKRGDKLEFMRVSFEHFDFLASRGIPGSAWFRYRAAQARKILEGENLLAESTRSVRGRSNDAIASTYNLMTGGTAVSENLRLNEAIERGDYRNAEIDISAVRGITVQEFNWDTLNEGLKLSPDPLANFIPSDQHVFFFPSFGSLMRTLDHVKSQGLQLLQLMQFQSESRDLLDKYQLQLGLQLNDMARLLGPQLVNSIAITGGDPDLETGTDLAFIFETESTTALSQLFEAQISLASGRAGIPGLQKQTGEINGVEYRLLMTPDRKICSYQSVIGDAIVVTNSLTQLSALAATHQGKRDSIVGLPEYKFFRNRYPLSEESQAGLLFISDFTIRKWCGPAWRIGASRRLIARAAIAEEQAKFLAAKMQGKSSTTDERLHGLAGKISFESGRAQSTEYGNLSFLTPISEIAVTKVTSAERKAYETWRDSYERRWRRSFDPIAVQFQAGPTDWEVDVTVLPLIANTEYRQIRDMTEGASLNPKGFDEHEDALVQVSAALNRDNWLVEMARQVVRQQAPEQISFDPFSWLGSNISLYADADPIWESKKDYRNWIETAEDLPIGLSFEVSDRVKLIPFLTLLRGYVSSTVPGISWNTIEHQGENIVKISMSATEPAIYYGIAKNHLVLSFNADLIARAIQRGNSGNEDEQLDSGTLLGEHVAWTLKDGFLPVWESVFYSTFEETAKFDSWKNLPILNEWRRLFPDQNPIEVHEYFWRRNLTRHQAEQFEWNEEFSSLESSVFGRPGTPLDPKFNNIVPFMNISRADFGITFENSGLRARMKVVLND